MKNIALFLMLASCLAACTKTEVICPQSTIPVAPVNTYPDTVHAIGHVTPPPGR